MKQVFPYELLMIHKHTEWNTWPGIKWVQIWEEIYWYCHAIHSFEEFWNSIASRMFVPNGAKSFSVRYGGFIASGFSILFLSFFLSFSTHFSCWNLFLRGKDQQAWSVKKKQTKNDTGSPALQRGESLKNLVSEQKFLSAHFFARSSLRHFHRQFFRQPLQNNILFTRSSYLDTTIHWGRNGKKN